VSASVFVAYIPLILVLAAVFAGGQTAIAQSLIRRFGLTGSAAQTVIDLLNSPSRGIYWLGLLIVLWSAISIGRKLSRMYADIWRVPRLRLKQQWRAAVWLVLQVSMAASIAVIRDFWGPAGNGRIVIYVGASIIIWWLAEYAAQFILTAGQVPRRQLAVAAAVVTVGRVGLGFWTATYLADSLANQAITYGPIGVVFSIFTYIVAAVGVIVVGTLLASIWTSPATLSEPAADRT
jgi:uncharacterized BrkB/YihY/UPF0761 family membrane protein